jgi:hypothetical protein
MNVQTAVFILRDQTKQPVVVHNLREGQTSCPSRALEVLRGFLWRNCLTNEEIDGRIAQVTRILVLENTAHLGPKIVEQFCLEP